MGLIRDARALFAGEPGERLLVISGIVVTTQMAWGILVPVLPAYADSLGIAEVQIGMVVAAFGVGRVVANIPAGYLGRVVNRAHLLVGSAAAVVVFSALCGLANSFEWLLLLRVLTGAAGGIAITVGQTLLADVAEPSARARTMSFLQAMNLTGASIGPAVGGAASLFGLRAPFFVSGLFCLAMIIWLVARPRLRRSLEAVAADARPVDVDGNAHPGRSFLAACAVGFGVFFSRFGVQQTLIPLVAFKVIGLSVAELSLILSAMALLNFGCAVFLGGLSDRFGRKPVIVASLITVATAVLLLGLVAGTWWFAVVCALFGLATSIGAPVPAAYVADITSGQQRAAAIGVYRTVSDVAGVIAPVAVTALLGIGGPLSAAAVAAGVSLAAAGWFGALAAESRQ